MRRARGNFDFFRRYAWCVPSVADIFIIVALLLAGVLTGNLVAFLFVKFLGTEAALKYSMLVSYPVMFLPPMIWAASFSARASASRKGLSLDGANVKPLGWVLCVLLASLGTLALGVVCDPIGSLLPEMPDFWKNALKNLTTGNFWLNFLSVSIFAPFFEEWLCRGMILRGLLGRGTKPVWAIVLSAVFFAVIHVNPWQALPAFILGLFFGYVYYRTGSLKLTMLMHFVNNTVALTIGHIESLKDKETWMDVLGPSFWYCFAGCMLLAALTVLAFRRIPTLRPSGSFEVLKPLFGEE